MCPNSILMIQVPVSSQDSGMGSLLISVSGKYGIGIWDLGFDLQKWKSGNFADLKSFSGFEPSRTIPREMVRITDPSQIRKIPFF